MRRFFCILMCLGLAPMASAELLITNGNFESQSGLGSNPDILYWWDYGGPDLDTLAGPWWNPANSFSINHTKVAGMGIGSNEEEDGGNHAYLYQSIGTYEATDPQAVDIELDWGLIPTYTSDEMGVTAMILESDGTFEPNEWGGQQGEIYGHSGITELGRGHVMRYAIPATSSEYIFHERFLIDLTSATVGNELFLRLNSVRGDITPYIAVDNITMSLASVINRLPEDGAIYVPNEPNKIDLVFDIVDPDIVTVDILFGPENDPNLSSKPEYKIVEGMTVLQGQNTVDLDDWVMEDLQWKTEYSWKVLCYESGPSLKYTGHITSFTTVQEGPLLFEVTPPILGVWQGDDAVFSVSDCVKTDTFQWYKEGDPDTPLYDSDPNYTVVIVPDVGDPNGSILTIHDVQRADEGTYYCVGTELATDISSETLAPGQLFLKELKAHYPFETTYEDSGETYTPNIVVIDGSTDVQLMGEASVVSDTDPNALIGGFLALHNPRGDANADYASFLDASVAHYPEITISCWVKARGILDPDFEGDARIWDFGQDADNLSYLTILQGDDLAGCFTMLDGDDSDLDAVGEIKANQWLYVVLTIGPDIDEEGEPTTMAKLYLDGQYAGEGDLDILSEIPMTLGYIGKAIDTTDSPPNFNGLIDELKIYNYAKTADDIAQEYMDVMTEVEFICDMEANDLQDYDYDNSCRVDLPDVVAIAEKWLQNYIVYFE